MRMGKPPPHPSQLLADGPPVFAKNEQGKYAYANPAFLRLVGLDNEAAIRGLGDEALPWDPSGHGRAIFQADDQAVMENKVPLSKTEKIVVDGKANYFWLTKMPWIDKQGSVQGVIGYLANITTFKQQVRSQDESERLRDYKLGIYENLSTRLLHNWRSQALSIFALAGALEDFLSNEDALNEAELAEISQRLKQSGTANLRNVYRYIHELECHNNVVSIQEDEIFISGVLDTIAAMMLPCAQEKLLSLRFFEHEGPNCIRADAYRIEGALEEIVRNAIDFTQVGSVTLTSQISTNTDDETRFDKPLLLQITVRDTGVGIAKNDLERIFLPCVYLGEGHAHDDAHTGNGLTHAKNLMAELGGSIAVESTLGKGSVFTLNIPVSKAVLDLTPLLKETANVPLKVLLVEDNDIAAKIAMDRINNYGHEVVWATDGGQALEHIKKSAFDLVLMDINLGKDKDTGDVVTKKIREFESSKNMREEERLCIIGLTAQLDPSSRVSYLHCGMQEAITKPLSDENWAKIQIVIKGRLQRDTEYNRG